MQQQQQQQQLHHHVDSPCSKNGTYSLQSGVYLIPLVVLMQLAEYVFGVVLKPFLLLDELGCVVIAASFWNAPETQEIISKLDIKMNEGGYIILSLDRKCFFTPFPKKRRKRGEY